MELPMMTHGKRRNSGITTSTALTGIVTRNRAAILPKAILSALSQRDCGVRVAVIDDGSIDATSEVCQQFPEIKWERWPTSRGYVAARNHWMTSVNEEYFVGLDDDAWFREGDEIAIALNIFERDPKVAAVAFDILSPDRPDPVQRGSPEQAAMFIGCGHVLRLSAVRQAGGYETGPGQYGGEEKDLCLRLIDAGYKIMRLPGVHVWHDKTLVARDKPAQHQSGVCNDLVMTVRRTPALVLPLAFSVKLYRHGTFSLRNGLMRPFLEGFFLFARSIPAVWKSRHPVKMSTLHLYRRLARTR